MYKIPGLLEQAGVAIFGEKSGDSGIAPTEKSGQAIKASLA